MSTEINYLSQNSTKEEKYAHLLPQLSAVLKGEKDMIARMSSAMAVMHDAFNFLWVGVYFVKENELVVGPFQGPLACTRIAYGKGVCGKSWEIRQAILVHNVDEFPGHIACSSLSRSEIVVPSLKENGEVDYLIDIDSEALSAFDEVDLRNVINVIHIINNLN